MLIRTYQEPDEDAVVELWTACGLTRPWNDPRRDIARKLTVQRELFLVGLDEARVVATVMAGYDGHRGWINYLGVHPDWQRRGLATAMMAAAEQRLHAAGCPKINLQVRQGNAAALGFYAHLGFGRDEVLSLGKRLEPDQGGGGAAQVPALSAPGPATRA